MMIVDYYTTCTTHCAYENCHSIIRELPQYNK